MKAANMVQSTQDPAFAVDPKGKILAWNQAAERLLGHSESRILNQACWEVLAGRDVFGNDYCVTS